VSSGGSGAVNAECSQFRFFVTSQARLFALAKAFNGSDRGFGGDLRYGEAGPGAGLRGADKLCTQIAEASCAGNGKTWRAFLSVSDDGSGKAVNAIDRVGNGPWHDRKGRIFAMSRANLTSTRPTGADPAIVDDLPNEDGVPNHKPDGMTFEDNHNTMTGSDSKGQLAVVSSRSPTCKDWTDATAASEKSAVGPNIGDTWWGGTTGKGSAFSWIDAGHAAAGCQPGAIDLEADHGFGVGQGDVNCGTVGCSGGYGGFYCFALNE